ncbi:MAG: arginine--tRNA ligase [Eubacteriales bacterium]|nr:arginine--tRNA ligase [Eubacteriales bacterium]
MDYKSIIANLIEIEGISSAEIAALITPPKDSKMGDFCLPCFRFSKALRKSPIAIAEELAASITLPDCFEKAEAVAGYLNFTLDKKAYNKRIIEKAVAEGKAYGDQNVGEGKNVCIDYSSVNVAKPLHIGHLSSTAIGAALYRIYKKLGYNAIGINHLGDWGTQFGKLIVAYKLWGNDEDIEKRGVTALVEIYVRYHKEAEEKPEMDDEARAWFKKIEDFDPEATRLFNWFKEITLKEVVKIYDRLGIKFDYYTGESFYNDKMQPVLDLLEKKGLLVESDGAKVVDLSAYNMPPCLLVRSDGATLYATRDLAAAYYRKATFDFYKCLYVVAYQQNLHFKQWFKVVELAGESWAKDLVHVNFGMVSLPDGAIKTRAGNYILLEDVLNKSVEKALQIITEKSPDLENKEEVAEQVGIGAVLFSVLYNSRIKDIVFSYDRVLNFDGETGPYVQYTHARCNSVLKKASEYDGGEVDYSGISDEESSEVVKLIASFPEAVKAAAEKYEPCFVARHLVSLAQSYNRFYLANRIANAEPKIRNARVLLTTAVKNVLESGLALLGIAAPEKM